MYAFVCIGLLSSSIRSYRHPPIPQRPDEGGLSVHTITHSKDFMPMALKKYACIVSVWVCIGVYGRDFRYGFWLVDEIYQPATHMVQFLHKTGFG